MGNDNALNRRLGAHLAQPGPEEIEQHNRLGPGIAQLVLEFTAGVGRVDVDDQRPKAHGGEEGDEVVGRVGQHHGDALAFADAKLIKGGRQPVNQFVQLLVAELPANGEAAIKHVAQDKVGGRLRGISAGRVAKQVAQREVGVGQVVRDTRLVTCPPRLFHPASLRRMRREAPVASRLCGLHLYVVAEPTPFAGDELNRRIVRRVETGGLVGIGEQGCAADQPHDKSDHEGEYTNNLFHRMSSRSSLCRSLECGVIVP